MKPRISPEFLAAIPKTDLHLHLDGSLRLKTLIELSREAKCKLPSYTEAGLRKLVFKDHYKDLPDYLHGFMYTCAILLDLDNLERVAKELVEDNAAEGVRYIEVRFAPQLHVTPTQGVREIVRAVAAGLAAGAKAHNATKAVKNGDDVPFHYGIILCGMRRFKKGYSPYYADLLRLMEHAPKDEVFAAASLELARAAVELKNEGLPVVGFDLAGEEAGFPPATHWAAYQYVHDHFLGKTVHAGEAYGPESIWQGITQCHANRIGHGTFLFAHEMIQDPKIEDRKRYVEELANYLAAQRTGIEVCVTSNLQTIPTLKSLKDHPVRRMIDHGLSVSVCTDNRLVSNTTVTREMGLICENAKLTAEELKRVVVAGFKGSFFPGTFAEKRKFVRQVVMRYEKLERTMGPLSAPVAA